MSIPSLFDSYIDETFQRLVQTTGSGAEFADGLGNPITFPTTSTGSLLATASAVGSTITFTKGDGTTFPVTVAAGTGAPGGPFNSIQFNDQGLFNGTANFTYDTGSNTLKVTGSISATQGFTGSLFGTASYANQTLSASYAQSASYSQTASYVANDIITASVNLNTITFTKGNGTTFPITIDTGSGGGGTLTNTGSLLLTASAVDNTITFTKGDGTTFPVVINTGSAITNYVTTSSFNAFTSSVVTTSSFNNFTSSVVSTSSFNSFTASSAISASLALVTASVNLNTITFRKGDGSTFPITVNTGSAITDYVTTASFNSFTSSVVTTSSFNAFTSSVVTTSSFNSYTGSNTSQFAGTASYATTASFVTGSVFTNSNSAASASYAVTASYALNGGVTQIVAGPNITISPTTGLGQVTITSTGGGGSNFNTATGSYGSFYDTTIQPITVVGTVYSMSLNTTDISNGVSISGSTAPYSTYIKMQNGGVYDIQFSAQIDKTTGTNAVVYIWLRKNGTDIAETNTAVNIAGGANDKATAAWNWFVNAAAADYFQIVWASTNTNVRLFAAGPNAIDSSPAIPSLIVTANRVDQFLSNTGSFSGSFTGTLIGTASYASTASYIQTLKAGSGSIASFGGSPYTSSIAFTTAYANNLYAVTVTGEDARTWTIESKTSAGFTINTNSSVALTGPVYWISTPFNL